MSEGKELSLAAVYCTVRAEDDGIDRWLPVDERCCHRLRGRKTRSKLATYARSLLHDWVNERRAEHPESNEFGVILFSADGAGKRTGDALVKATLTV